MTPEQIITRLTESFPEGVKAGDDGSLDPYVRVNADKLLAVAKFLRDDARIRLDYLNDVTAVDYLETDPKKLAKAGFEPHLEVVYHLSRFSQPGLRFKLKVELPRWRDNVEGELPELPSVCDIWAGAEWHEREAYDLVGVKFQNHPDLRRLLLADDWVGYPLRKDYEFPTEYHGIRCR